MQHTITKEDRDHIMAILRDRNGMDLRLLEIGNELMDLNTKCEALKAERLLLAEKRKQINNSRLAEKFEVVATTISYIAEGRTS